MTRSSYLIALILVVLGSPLLPAAHGQEKSPAAKKDTKAAPAAPDAPAAPKKEAAAAPGLPAVPDEVALNILVRRTLLTLNDANLSNNYAVLLALAGPGFQSKNDVKKLEQNFAELRKSGLDLAPAAYLVPRLKRKPEITKEGLLRLSGFVPSKPVQVNFEMAFQNVDKRWRIDGIAVATNPVQPTAAKPATPPAPAAGAATAPAKDTAPAQEKGQAKKK
jgi:hypothetical protein